MGGLLSKVHGDNDNNLVIGRAISKNGVVVKDIDESRIILSCSNSMDNLWYYGKHPLTLAHFKENYELKNILKVSRETSLTRVVFDEFGVVFDIKSQNGCNLKNITFETKYDIGINLTHNISCTIKNFSIISNTCCIECTNLSGHTSLFNVNIFTDILEIKSINKLVFGGSCEIVSKKLKFDCLYEKDEGSILKIITSVLDNSLKSNQLNLSKIRCGFLKNCECLFVPSKKVGYIIWDHERYGDELKNNHYIIKSPQRIGKWCVGEFLDDGSLSRIFEEL